MEVDSTYTELFIFASNLDLKEEKDDH